VASKPEDLDAALADAASQLAVPLGAGQRQSLIRYLELLQRWNATYNLTSVRDPGQMLTQHLVDCLAVVGPLQRHLGGRPARLLDVGSGGGLPGVVLAAALPQVEVTCVDTVGKKAAFVRQVAAELALQNLRGVHARVESLKGEFDVITSRAFAALPLFCRLTRSRLASDGLWMAMKGRVPDDEIAALPPDVAVFHVEHLEVPGLNAERCLIWMRPA
jgi:16S rRNA (guanine527-N7)-methyltransferase